MADAQSTAAQQAPLTMDLATATLQEIVLFMDGCCTPAPGILDFVGALAKQQSARLIGIFVRPPTALSKAESFAHGKGIQEALDAHESEMKGIEAPCRAAFDKVVHRNELRSDWKSLDHFSSEVAKHAYYADLVVIARPGSEALSTNLASLPESLVLSSGRPVILFPPGGKVPQVRRIVVAWNATRQSVRATADAMPLLVRAEAVQVLVVDPQRHRVFHDQEAGASIAQHLTRRGARVEVRRVPAAGRDVGQQILSQADAFKADLLVMGAYGHSQVRQWVFGGVTRTVLYEANIPVLMSR
jgi:nucleotide-binding universal stress UspA family protein